MVKNTSTVIPSEAKQKQLVYLCCVAVFSLQCTMGAHCEDWLKIFNYLAFQLQHTVLGSPASSVAQKAQEWITNILKDMHKQYPIVQDGEYDWHTTWKEEESCISDYYISTLIKLYLPDEAKQYWRVRRLLEMTPEERAAIERAGEADGQEFFNEGGESGQGSDGDANASIESDKFSGVDGEVTSEGNTRGFADASEPNPINDKSSMAEADKSSAQVVAEAVAPSSTDNRSPERTVSNHADGGKGDMVAARPEVGHRLASSDNAEDAGYINLTRSDGDDSAAGAVSVPTHTKHKPETLGSVGRGFSGRQDEDSSNRLGDASTYPGANKSDAVGTDANGANGPGHPTAATGETASTPASDSYRRDEPPNNIGGRHQDELAGDFGAALAQVPEEGVEEDEVGLELHSHTLGLVQFEWVPPRRGRSPDIDRSRGSAG